jgi:diguanylate cyclase (GGDEF)-like protein
LISEEARQTEELHYLDDLTGLHNRRYFREKLLEEKRNADEKGAAFALMMIDLDNFKPVNDLYGHLTGDKVLTEVGRLLKKSLRPSDILCRYAGDEFVAIIPRTTEADVVRLAENITKSLSEAPWVDVSGSPIHPVTCSLGYAFYSEAGKDPTALISWADQALYAAKRRGGNGHCGEKDIPAEPIGRPLVSTPYIVGREKEFSQLRSLLEQVRREGGMLAFVDGEVGVGKTRLMRELRQFFERRGGTALSGGCFVETGSIPYYPFRDAFRRFFEERKKEGLVLLDILPAYSRKELARILPGLADLRVSELDRAPDSYRLFEAVRLLLQRISAKTESPLLLTIEDIHWSDKASLDLLHYLARNLGEAPVLLCATYRTEEEHKGANLPPFLASMRAERLAEEIHLGALSPESVSAMIYLLYPGIKFPRELHESLYRKTEGNPFFVEELLKALDPEQMMEGLSRVEPVPVSLKAILGSRIDSLSPETRDVLACSALVGEEFEFEVVCKVLDRPMCDIIDALEEGAKNHIITEVLTGGRDTYKFTHSLMADVLSSGISQMRSRMWHQQVGTTLEEMYSGRPEQVQGRLIHHFERGEDSEKALQYALKAADQAKNDYGNEEAIRYYKKARVMTHRLKRETTDEEIAISEGLGDVHMLTSNFDEALRCYEEALKTMQEKDDKTGEARVLLKAGGVHVTHGDYERAMECYETSSELQCQFGDRKGEAEALTHIAGIQCDRGNHEKALEYLEEAKAIFIASQDERGLASVLQAIGHSNFDLGNLTEALDCCRQALDINRKIGNRNGEARNLNSIGTWYWNHGKFKEAIDHFQRAFSILQETGDKNGAALCLHNAGIIHANWGEYDEALNCYQESLEIHREVGNKRGTAMSLHSIGIIQWCRGDYSDAMKSQTESIQIKRELGGRHNIALSQITIGSLEIDRGEYWKALENLKEALDTLKAVGDNWGMAFGLSELGRVHQGLQNCEKALEHHRASLALMEEIGLEAERSELLAATGIDHHLLGDDEKAMEALDEALRIAVELGAKEAEPVALEALAEVCLSRGDLERAEEYCERLLTIARERGLKRYLGAGKRVKGQLLVNEAASSGWSPAKLDEAESELVESAEIADRIGALPLLWQAEASLGKFYEKKGDKKKASRHLSKAKEVIEQIASKVKDESLKLTYLNSPRIKPLLTPRAPPPPAPPPNPPPPPKTPNPQNPKPGLTFSILRCRVRDFLDFKGRVWG